MITVGVGGDNMDRPHYVNIFYFHPFFLQMIIEQLEHERNMMANAIAEKMQEHQHLLQVRMDLGMEVAAYR